MSTPEAEFPEWAELWQIIFPPLRVITSSKFHLPSGSLIAFYMASDFRRFTAQLHSAQETCAAQTLASQSRMPQVTLRRLPNISMSPRPQEGDAGEGGEEQREEGFPF